MKIDEQADADGGTDQRGRQAGIAPRRAVPQLSPGFPPLASFPLLGPSPLPVPQCSPFGGAGNIHYAVPRLAPRPHSANAGPNSPQVFPFGGADVTRLTLARRPYRLTLCPTHRASPSAARTSSSSSSAPTRGCSRC